MKWPRTALLLAGCCLAGVTYARDYETHDYYALHLRPDADPSALAQHLGLTYDGKLGELDDHHLFRTTRSHGYDHVNTEIANLNQRRRKRSTGWDTPHLLDHILLSQKQELHKRFPLVKRDHSFTKDSLADDLSPAAPQVDSLVQKGLDIAKELEIEDPIYQEQWHLYNAAQPGHDINVTGVWQQGVTGKNSTVCIVDDGLDMDSNDLKANYFREGSYDFNDHVDDPKPRLSDDKHGTRCAGEISAVRNDVCGVGVAYDGKVSGVRILSKVISDADEAIALNYGFQSNQIYSCSWGPPDDGQSMEQPGILIRRAMLTGIQKGRQGLGSIFVFACGNGAANDDNCNFDGYTNSIYSVSVGGIDRKGLHPYYSEKCSAQLVVTYSSGSGDAIHTTDVGLDQCYTNHGGTSAAGPLVAGMYALMLEVNPTLTWRDIQWITALTAVKIDQPSDWVMNKGIGKEFSHQFGYGKADAWALVESAKNWTNVKPQAWFFSPWMHVEHKIPQGDKGLASSFEVKEDMLKKANFERIEHVTVTMNVEHTRRGDLSVELKSPDGFVSHIATTRRSDEANAGYVDWTFMSVAHWGESGIGKWTVIVKDTNINEHSGVFTDWKLRLWGECIDAESQTLLPMPTEHDDDDHEDNIRTSVIPSTTSIAVPTDTGAPAGNPTDHPHRPINNKVSTTPSLPTDAAGVPTGTLPPTPPEDQPDKSKPTDSSDASNFLPRPFPTFGVNKHTQIWIYGTLVLIIIFLSCIAGYWYHHRRKTRWMNNQEYDFELVNREDTEGGEGYDDPNAGARGAAAGATTGRGRPRRAGELYDAFAGGSEDEDGGAFGLHDGESDESGAESEVDEKGRGSRYRDDVPLREGTDVK
ncbi:hypothetical protein MBLNU230_g6578t1 [Neophaeotheca triangularis]